MHEVQTRLEDCRREISRLHVLDEQLEVTKERVLSTERTQRDRTSFCREVLMAVQAVVRLAADR